jgi:predicted alpha/beta hydrolase
MRCNESGHFEGFGVAWKWKNRRQKREDSGMPPLTDVGCRIIEAWDELLPFLPSG